MSSFMVKHSLRFARNHPRLAVKTSYRLARRPRTVLTGIRTAQAANSAVRDPEIRQQVLIAGLALSGAAHRIGELKEEPPKPRRGRTMRIATTGTMLAASALIGHKAARKIDP
jgi:hypothetical protein